MMCELVLPVEGWRGVRWRSGDTSPEQVVPPQSPLFRIYPEIAESGATGLDHRSGDVSSLGLRIRHVGVLDEFSSHGVDGCVGLSTPFDHHGEGLEGAHVMAPHQHSLGALDGGAMDVNRTVLGNVTLGGGGPGRVSPLVQRVEQAGARVEGGVRGRRWTGIPWSLGGDNRAAIRSQAAGCPPNPRTGTYANGLRVSRESLINGPFVA